MSLLDKFRRCQLCRDPRPKDCAKVVVNGGKELRICSKCEKILELSNAVASGQWVSEPDVEEPL